MILIDSVQIGSGGTCCYHLGHFQTTVQKNIYRQRGRYTHTNIYIYIYIERERERERERYTKNVNCVCTLSRGSRAGTWDFQFLLCGKHYLFDPPKPFSFSIRLPHILAGHMAVQIKDSISQPP